MKLEQFEDEARTKAPEPPMIKAGGRKLWLVPGMNDVFLVHDTDGRVGYMRMWMGELVPVERTW